MKGHKRSGCRVQLIGFLISAFDVGEWSALNSGLLKNRTQVDGSVASHVVLRLEMYIPAACYLPHWLFNRPCLIIAEVNVL
jgi:hypothetical protein